MAVCVDRPLLSLDRPFTYRLPGELGAGLGSLVQVPFHGRSVRGWVLGATDDVPRRVLPVRKAVSPVRFFDARLLDLYRWMSERYVAPLATVIGRSVPPRVAGEEPSVDVAAPSMAGPGGPASVDLEPPTSLLQGYRGGREMLSALRSGTGAFLVRPGPADEQALAVEAVGECRMSGRSAIVVVPEAEPVPATAARVVETFGDEVAVFLGGERRRRYRMWLDIAAGRYPVVVGTRPGVFARVSDLGLVWVARESHPGHREERAPYFHVRDVALARARIDGAVCVLSAACPSAEAFVSGASPVEPAKRSWPPVEVVRPGPEGRAPRLVAAVKQARQGFLYQPLPGYGVARVCRACGSPAACAACRGTLRLEAGSVRCAVCEAPGRCAGCGAADFGIARGGAERVEEWAGRIASVPIRRVSAQEPFRAPGDAEVVVGGAEAVKDAGPLGLDLVGILDADAARRRPGLGAVERSLALWMEAAAWAAPHGRVIVQTSHPGDPAVQALVTGNPERFHRRHLPEREAAGFAAGCPVFRVAGTGRLAGEMEALRPMSLLTSGAGDQTVCLVTVRPGDVAAFGRAIRALAVEGIVTRVEAEPHL